MAEKDRQIDAYQSPLKASEGKQRNPDILRAKDIIPGEAGDSSVSRVDIPQFDLAEDIMAEQRRLIALRRKAPSSVVTHPLSPVKTDDGRETLSAEWDPVIASIVARDIERLCAGGSWT